MTDKLDWGWWIGCSDEIFTSGPESKEEAIRIAREEYEGAHICEARKEPVKLHLQFDLDSWLEECEERLWGDHVGENGDCLFDLSQDERRTLKSAIRGAIEKWQEDRGRVFMPFMFTESRNHEYIPGPDESELN